MEAFVSGSPPKYFQWSVSMSLLILKELAILGRWGRITKQGHNMKFVGLSCVHPVYFLHKSTEFHDMRTECQRILINFLLLIPHK